MDYLVDLLHRRCLLDVLSSQELLVMFEGPTIVTELPSSQIDYIVSNRTMNLQEVTTEVNPLSDHNILLVKFGGDREKNGLACY